MAKADKLALGATLFCIAVLAGTFLENFYGYVIALVIGSFLFWILSTIPGTTIAALTSIMLIGIGYGSLHGRSAKTTQEPTHIEQYLFVLKDSLVAHITHALPGDEGALGAGLILGDQRSFSVRFKQAMRLSGTTHLVALSGFNIAILVAAIDGFIRGRVRRAVGFWIITGCIGIFVVMVGAQASVVRAAIMGIVILFAKYNGRMPTYRTCITVTGMIMVALNPRIIRWDIGFQLSFLSFIGIVYVAPSIAQFLARRLVVSNIAEQIIASIAAQALVLPLIINVFGSASLIGIFATVAIAYTVPLAMALSVIIACAGIVSDALGTIIGWFAYPILWYDVHVIYFFSRIPISIQTPIHHWVPILVYYILIFLFVRRYYPRESFVYKFPR